MSDKLPDQETTQTRRTPAYATQEFLDSGAQQARMIRPASLVVIDGRNLGAMFELADTPAVIGRDPDADLMIDEVGVSRHHARVWLCDGQAWVRDTDSKNGTYLNGEPVRESCLQDGDLLFVGQTTLKYLAQDNVEQAYYEYLRQVTVEDPLTRIPNRRYFDEYIVREVARTRRYRRPLALLMLDVDRFKGINDTYGHLCGDAILRELAALVTGRLRQSEFIARYGGEEFALVLPETDVAGARVIGERIRVLVDGHTFRCNDLEIPVTVSIGGAAWTDTMRQVRDLIAQADRRLYEAKQAGRNRVVC